MTLDVLKTFVGWMRQLLPQTVLGKAVFILLVGVGIFLRVAGLTWGIPDRENQSSVYHDEGHVLGSVLLNWDDFKEEFGEYEIVRPVFFWRIIARPIIAAGTSLGLNDATTRVFELAVLRAITAIVAIAGLLAVYMLGRRLGSDVTGLWALGFLVFMPGHWYYSQILKGDVMIVTFFALILLMAIRMASSGDRWAYVVGGLVFGAGVAIKATTIIAAPVLLIAHLMFAWKQRQWRVLLGGNVWLILLVTIAAFLVLYPYPFIDFARLQALLDNPSTQHFTPVLFVSPQTYAHVWGEYNLSLRPFGEMIYGKFLVKTVIPLLFIFIIIGLVQFVRGRRSDLLLLAFMAFIFFHSLTFTGVLDERYLLPSAPFAALFPALLITGVGLPAWRWLSRIMVVVGSILLVGTAAITWITFPSFAFNNPREQVIDWVNTHASKGTVIAQPSQLSRWALRFNRDIYRVANIVYGPEGDRHIARLVDADYVVIQRDPWNYDHSFRYEFEDLKDELEPFLGRYAEHQRFGKVPMLFGWRIPQNLGTPVIDVYFSPTSVGTVQPIPSLVGDRIPILRGSAMSLVPAQRCDEAGKSYLQLRLRSNLTVPNTREGRVYIAVARQSSSVSPALPKEKIREPSVAVVDGNPTLFIPLSIQDLYDHPEFTLAVDFPDCERVVFYTGLNNQLTHTGEGASSAGSGDIKLFILSGDIDTSLGFLEVVSATQVSE